MKSVRLSSFDDEGRPWPITLEQFVEGLVERFPILKPFEYWLKKCASSIRAAFEANKAEALEAQLKVFIERQKGIIDYYEKLIAKLIEEVRHDDLTGLFNLRYLLERLDQMLAMPDLGRVAALAKIDIRHFKFYNDRPGLGHHVGDEVIKCVAKTMLASTRQSPDRVHPDICVRRSGDEFIIVMFDLPTVEEGKMIAQRFKEGVRECSLVDVLRPEEAAIIATEQPVEADVGLAFLIFTRSDKEKAFRVANHRQIANDWIVQADMAMYENKKFQSTTVEPVVLSIEPESSQGRTVRVHDFNPTGHLL